MSPARIVWRPRSVNIGGGLWWDCCLFVFHFTHTTEGQCERLHGRDWDVSFLTLSSPGVEAPGSPPALCYTEFSQSTGEAAAFPIPLGFKYIQIQRLSGNFFLLCYIAKSAFTNTENNPVSTDKWRHPCSILLC